MNDLRTAAQALIDREKLEQVLSALAKLHGDTSDGFNVVDVETEMEYCRAALEKSQPTNQCGEVCERAKLCAVCARGLEHTQQDMHQEIKTAWQAGYFHAGYTYDQAWADEQSELYAQSCKENAKKSTRPDGYVEKTAKNEHEPVYLVSRAFLQEVCKIMDEIEGTGHYDMAVHDYAAMTLKDEPLTICRQLKQCSTHPDAPHGFDRNASHAADRYVCTCEGWEPDVTLTNEGDMPKIGCVNHDCEICQQQATVKQSLPVHPSIPGADPAAHALWLQSGAGHA